MPLLSGQSTIGFQPLILNVNPTVVLDSNKEIIWMPDKAVKTWLLEQLKPENNLLAHLTLKGNFICNQEKTLYLDGEMFDGTDLKNGSGDGRRGGDFEMWFWLKSTKSTSGETIAPPTASTQPRSRRSRPG